MTGVTVRLQCVCVTERKGGGKCECFCLFLAGSAFTSMTLMHAACHHRRCMCGCAHAEQPGERVAGWDECESMTDAHHI